MKILLPVDLSNSSMHVIRFLASRKNFLGTNPQIELLHVHTPMKRRFSFFIGQGVADDYYEEHAERIFTRARKIFDDEGLKVTESLMVGEPDVSIAGEAERFNADLVVMGTRGLGALNGLFKNSVSTGVLSKANCPVLLVRGKEYERPDVLKIGIAVDGSEYGEKAVRYVLKHIRLFGMNAEFYLINVVENYRDTALLQLTDVSVPSLSEDDVEELEQNSFEDAMSKVRPLFRATGLKPQEVRLIGNPADEIMKYAKKNGFNLIVMGSHGYSRLQTAVLGSTAVALASEGEIPLLVIKDKPRAAGTQS